MTFTASYFVHEALAMSSPEVEAWSNWTYQVQVCRAWPLKGAQNDVKNPKETARSFKTESVKTSLP